MEGSQFDDHIFHMGWFNHQPGKGLFSSMDGGFLGVWDGVAWNVPEPDSRTWAKPFCDFGMFGNTPWKINMVHPQITHLERKMIWNKPPWGHVPAVNLQGCMFVKGCWRLSFLASLISSYGKRHEKHTMKVALAADLDGLRLENSWLHVSAAESNEDTPPCN